jgi:hypothetical protein
MCGASHLHHTVRSGTPARCSSRRPAPLVGLLLALAPRRPGRRCGCPAQARPQLLGHDLDHRSGAAILSRPCPLLEPTTTTTRLPFDRDWLACSAWSRQTITVKNDASCSLRPDTATRNMARAMPPSV